MDRGLAETAEAGVCPATRLIRFPNFGINMTSGASMVVEARLAEHLVDDIHAEQAGALAAYGQARPRQWGPQCSRPDVVAGRSCFCNAASDWLLYAGKRR
jgi:hypothetical protein